jgi:hypothetical protein
MRIVSKRKSLIVLAALALAEGMETKFSEDIYWESRNGSTLKGEVF